MKSEFPKVDGPFQLNILTIGHINIKLPEPIHLIGKTEYIWLTKLEKVKILLKLLNYTPYRSGVME
jgi:serine kinase of HPr protein (carbohydrate metabolism regulator)